ncbi:MAG: hypothetical protein JO060_05830, partial [Candidatus Eremiobacteraeota bacterium]|nr:hypothetical protein [Candidatus Eremiobacteraeota bacterium]
MPRTWRRGTTEPFARLGAHRIIDAVADAAKRWCDADFPLRVRTTAAIRERTGYSEPVVDYALDRLFEALNRDALTAAIEGELGAVDALDGFVARGERGTAFASPVGRLVVVASETTIGVALPPALFALCARCEVLVRDRSDALVRAFSQTLAEERPDVAARLHVNDATAHDDPAWLAELARADAVVAFGSAAALKAIRAQTPAETRFIAYGHRTSASYVAREALMDDAAAQHVADDAALDALLYDGEGCLSSHALFLERGSGVDLNRFTAMVVAACGRAAIEFPPGAVEMHPSVAAYRNAASFRASRGYGRVMWDARACTLVALEPPREEPPPLLPRTLALYAIDGPKDFALFAQTHRLPLEAV